MLLRTASRTTSSFVNYAQTPSFRFNIMSFSAYAKVKLPTGREVNLPVGAFINDEFVAAKSGETFTPTSPSTGESLPPLPSCDVADLNIATAVSRKAFQTTWGLNCPGDQRGKLLNKLADLMERDTDRLAEVEAWDAGKNVRVTREADIADSVTCLRYYAGWADKVKGQTLETNKNKFAFTRHEPIGVCGQIVPWNYPTQMTCWKIAPALAVGCTVILKPSEETTYTALMLAELIKEAGFPPGVFQVLPGFGRTIGQAIAESMEIDKVAFTGSTVTGRKIMHASASSNLKSVTLELGGKSAHIIFEKADLEQATNWAMLGFTFNGGQDCTCGSRLLVQGSVYDEVCEMLIKKTGEMKVGGPFDEDAQIGSMVSPAQFDKVMGYIKAGKEGGAKCLVGGNRWGDKGCFIEPTIFADADGSMKIAKEEIFGPVLTVIKFDTEEEAIEIANSSEYGLGAGLHSQDANQCMRVSAALQAGTVWINSYMVLGVNMPFGGYKQSGFGRELGEYALDTYTVVKGCHMNIGDKLSWPF